MSKGARHRAARRAARTSAEAEIRRRAEAAAERAAFFATWDPEDDEEGPALPCPECAAFGRRWATPDERAAALAAFDAAWGLVSGTEDARRVAVCIVCGAAAVTAL